MRRALAAAEEAAGRGEVPVGAVITLGDQIVAVAHNERETGSDPTAHAEIVALRRAAAAVGNWRLNDAHLYVTMEPCPMCAGALVNARIRRLYFGCDDPKAGRGAHPLPDPGRPPPQPPRRGGARPDGDRGRDAAARLLWATSPVGSPRRPFKDQARAKSSSPS